MSPFRNSSYFTDDENDTFISDKHSNFLTRFEIGGLQRFNTSIRVYPVDTCYAACPALGLTFRYFILQSRLPRLLVSVYFTHHDNNLGITRQAAQEPPRNSTLVSPSSSRIACCKLRT